MAKKVIMEFKRGNGVSHSLRIPIGSYVAGSTLWFTAKPIVDNDNTDGAAVINKSFTDSNVTLSALYATYDLEFVPGDISTILYQDGESRIDYVGEFTYDTPGLSPVTFPADDTFIVARIYADIRLES